MKSGWMVRHSLYYEVYRLKDAEDPKSEIELDSFHERRESAEARAQQLNGEEAEHFWRRDE